MPGTAEQLRVAGLTPLTSIDYPGQLSAVVFCQGCPWNCCYCHNPDLIPSRGSGRVAWADVRAFLERRQGLLDAVVFSGGEPMAQAALPAALQEVRGLSYLTAIHTAGMYPERLQHILPLLDWVGLDIKAPEADYARITGVADSGQPAWESARILIASDIDYEIRITAHPALLEMSAVEGMLLRLERMGAERVMLQPLQPVPTASGLPRDLAPANMAHYADIVQRHGNCRIQGQ